MECSLCCGSVLGLPLESFPNSPYGLRGVPSPGPVSPLAAALFKLRRSPSTKGSKENDLRWPGARLRPGTPASVAPRFLNGDGISVQRDLLRANASSGPIRVSGPGHIVVKLLPVRRFIDRPETDKELDEEGRHDGSNDQPRQF